MLDTASGPGAAGSGGRFEAVFDSFADRRANHFQQPAAILGGMVGSSIGWIEAPYVACPRSQAVLYGLAQVRRQLTRGTPADAT